MAAKSTIHKYVESFEEGRLSLKEVTADVARKSAMKDLKESFW
jgi:hypothetical protein